MNVNGLVGKIEKNAEWATLALGVWLRSKEVGGPTITNILETAAFEAVKTFSSFEYAKYKLWDAQHTSQALTKAGLIIYAASELGLIHKKNLGKKIAQGGVLTSIITPGSGPATALDNFMKSPTVASYGGY